MKTIKVTVVIFIILSVFSFSAYAVEKGEYFESQLEASGADELYSSVDSDTKEALGQLGIYGADFDSIFDISPQKAFSFITDIIHGRWKESAESVIKILGVILLLAVGESFISEDGKMRNLMNVLGVLMCAAVLSVPLYRALEAAVSSVGLCCTFIKALIPVLAGAVIASGNPLTAVSFQSWAFAAAQFISSVCQSFIVPIVGAVIAVDISAAIMPEYKLDAVTNLIKKSAISVLSFTSTLYVSFLGIKGALSSSADSVAGKGIQLLISSAVPVVGGALSEAYGGIIGSLSLVKSTLGVFGIITVAASTLPSVIRLLFWIFSLRVCAAAGEMFRQSEISKLLSSLASALVLMNAVLLFNGVLFIISIALTLNLK